MKLTGRTIVVSSFISVVLMFFLFVDIAFSQIKYVFLDTKKTSSSKRKQPNKQKVANTVAHPEKNANENNFIDDIDKFANSFSPIKQLQDEEKSQKKEEENQSSNTKQIKNANATSNNQELNQKNYEGSEVKKTSMVMSDSESVNKVMVIVKDQITKQENNYTELLTKNRLQTNTIPKSGNALNDASQTNKIPNTGGVPKANNIPETNDIPETNNTPKTNGVSKINDMPKTNNTSQNTSSSKQEVPTGFQKPNVRFLGKPGNIISNRYPIRVVIAEDDPTYFITLGVGMVTRFELSSPPKNLVFGNLEGLGFAKGSSPLSFFLRPTVADLSTNLFIEFETGETIMINLVTVSGNKLKPGDYTAEVFVKAKTITEQIVTPSEMDRLTQTRTKQTDNTDSKGNQIFKQKIESLETTVSKLEERIQQQRTLSEASWKLLTNKKSLKKKLLDEPIKVTLLGITNLNNTYYYLLEVSNSTNKKQTIQTSTNNVFFVPEPQNILTIDQKTTLTVILSSLDKKIEFITAKGLITVQIE